MCGAQATHNILSYPPYRISLSSLRYLYSIAKLHLGIGDEVGDVEIPRPSYGIARRGASVRLSCPRKNVPLGQFLSKIAYIQCKIKMSYYTISLIRSTVANKSKVTN